MMGWGKEKPRKRDACAGFVALNIGTSPTGVVVLGG